MGRRAIAAIGAGAAVLALPGAAGSATFTVDSARDRIDADLGDEVCSDSKGKCTLRAAVSEANDTDGPDRIDLAAKTYRLTRPPKAGRRQPRERPRLDGGRDHRGRGQRPDDHRADGEGPGDLLRRDAGSFERGAG